MTQPDPQGEGPTLDAASRGPDTASLPGQVPDARRRGEPCIPGYDVLGLLGQGGMGQVWRARDTRLGRLVALKVILAGAQASATQRARFQLEGEALASLKHPNIVQIYDVGEHEGMSYLALELVEGGSLTQVLSGKCEDPRRAAQIVRTLALAMHAAHLRGIIHRDLKPGNVLLQRTSGNASPQDTWAWQPTQGCLLTDFEPKITDFGLAKRLEGEDSNTMTGAIVGTPSYMAPEQTTGDPHAVGPHTDVYALGALLYELLTGRPPFQGGSPLATIKMVQEFEATPPRQIQPRTPRDLEVICLKALHKEPRRRYVSAEALAEDLRRFLDLEPIEARPTPFWERAVKWARRRPTLAALISVSAVALAALVAILTWSNRELRLARDRAERQLNTASDVVEDMYVRVAEEWLADEPHKDPLQREFLEKALALNQLFVEESGHDATQRRRRALASYRLARIYRAFDEAQKARHHFDQAIALQEELRAEFPDDAEHQRDLAQSYNWRGELHREAMKLAEAEADYLKAMPLRAGLRERFPGAPIHEQELAQTEGNLGIVAHDRGRFDDARGYYDRAAARLALAQRAAPAAALYRHELGRLLINRGVTAKQTRRFQEAEEDFRRAVDLLSHRDSGRAKAMVKRDLALAHQNLGNLYFTLNRLDEALAALTPATDILQALVADFPTRPIFQRKLASVLNTVGSVHARRPAATPMARAEHADNALKAWTESWRLLGSIEAAKTGKDEAALEELRGRVQGNLGLHHAMAGEFAQARKWLLPALASLEKAWKTNRDSLELRQALSENCRNLAEVAATLGDHAETARAARLLVAARAFEFQDDYYAACFLCRASRKAREDSALDKAKRTEVAEGYLAEAGDLLKKAAAGGRRVQRFQEDDKILSELAGHVEYASILAHFTAPGMR